MAFAQFGKHDRIDHRAYLLVLPVTTVTSNFPYRRRDYRVGGDIEQGLEKMSVDVPASPLAPPTIAVSLTAVAKTTPGGGRMQGREAENNSLGIDPSRLVYEGDVLRIPSVDHGQGLVELLRGCFCDLHTYRISQSWRKSREKYPAVDSVSSLSFQGIAYGSDPYRYFGESMARIRGHPGHYYFYR